MFRLLRKWLLGGNSDKREASWLIFVIINAILIYAVAKESNGVEMQQTWAFLIISWPTSLSAVIGVHVQHFHAQAQAGRARNELGAEYDSDHN